MIVVMRRDAKEEDIQAMIKQVESLKLKPTVLRGVERTVIAAIGDERVAAAVGVLESGPGVDEVLPVLAPYKLASVETKNNRRSSARAALPSAAVIWA
jgi:3-deoxy-7-phosphoheptulonate synthase